MRVLRISFYQNCQGTASSYLDRKCGRSYSVIADAWGNVDRDVGNSKYCTCDYLFQLNLFLNGDRAVGGRVSIYAWVG